jgi:hypothetical protein
VVRRHAILGDEAVFARELHRLQSVFSIMVRDAPAQQPPWQTPYPAEKARGGGEIILRTRQQRMIFAGGLIAAVVIVLLLGVLAAFFA